MIQIQLKRTGGFMGKAMQVSREVDMKEDALIKKLTKLAPVENPMARDDFNYSIIINGEKTFPIDMTLIKGSLKKLLQEMEENLIAD
jgi:hypothetical protein